MNKDIEPRRVEGISRPKRFGHDSHVKLHDVNTPGRGRNLILTGVLMASAGAGGFAIGHQVGLNDGREVIIRQPYNLHSDSNGSESQEVVLPEPITKEHIELLERIKAEGKFTEIPPIDVESADSLEGQTIAAWGTQDTIELIDEVVGSLQDRDQVNRRLLDRVYSNADLDFSEVRIHPGVTDVLMQKEFFHQTEWYAWVFVSGRDVKVFARTVGNAPAGYHLTEATGINGEEGYELYVSIGHSAIEAARKNNIQSLDGTPLPKSTGEVILDNAVYEEQILAFPQIIVIPNHPTGFTR